MYGGWAVTSTGDARPRPASTTTLFEATPCLAGAFLSSLSGSGFWAGTGMSGGRCRGCGGSWSRVQSTEYQYQRRTDCQTGVSARKRLAKQRACAVGTVWKTDRDRVPGAAYRQSGRTRIFGLFSIIQKDRLFFCLFYPSPADAGYAGLPTPTRTGYPVYIGETWVTVSRL